MIGVRDVRLIKSLKISRRNWGARSWMDSVNSGIPNHDLSREVMVVRKIRMS